jgi:hypothetical protein
MQATLIEFNPKELDPKRYTAGKVYEVEWWDSIIDGVFVKKDDKGERSVLTKNRFTNFVT